MYNPGDILSIQYGGFKHYGIFIGDDTVIHNSKQSKKVEQISIDGFADNKTINISDLIKADNSIEAIEKATSYLGMSYNLFSENCEHFVRTACGLIKESTQIQKYAIVAIGGGMLFNSDNPVIRTVGAVTAIAATLTPSEKSPMKNVFGLALLVGALSLLETKE